MPRNSSGMALHFFDCFEELFDRRLARGHLPPAARSQIKTLLGQGQQDLLRARSAFYSALDTSWSALETGNGGASFDAVRQASHSLARAARQWVDQLYPFAGLEAARADSEINRVWRDLHTASQHPLLAFPA